MVKVLVIDDDVEFQQAIDLVLEKNDFEVASAYGPEEGLKKVPYHFGPHEEWLPVDYFMDKPVDPDVLVEKVKELLNIAV